MCEYNSFYNVIYVTKTFQLAIDRKLIYTVCLKTTYASLRVLQKNNIVLWNNDAQMFYDQANHPCHRLDHPKQEILRKGEFNIKLVDETGVY